MWPYCSADCHTDNNGDTKRMMEKWEILAMMIWKDFTEEGILNPWSKEGFQMFKKERGGVFHMQRISLSWQYISFLQIRKKKEITWSDQSQNKRESKPFPELLAPGSNDSCHIPLLPSQSEARFLCFHSQGRPPLSPPCCHTLCRTLLGCPEKHTEAAMSS